MKKVKRDKTSAKAAESNQKGLDLRSEASSRTTKETAEEKKERHKVCKRRREDSMEDDEWNRIVRNLTKNEPRNAVPMT